MRIPRIVKILFVLLVLWLAWKAFSPGKGEIHNGPVSLRIVGAHYNGRFVLLKIQNTGKGPLDPRGLKVMTSGPCSLVKGTVVLPGEESTLEYNCPGGRMVRVEGGNTLLTRRIT